MSLGKIKLSDRGEIPQVGLGLWQVTDKKDFVIAFNSAVENGYRLFDTAQSYENEYLLGQAMQDLGHSRQEFFISTKISVDNIKDGKTVDSFMTSLKNLRTSYVDLLLLHFPVTGSRKNAWLELERIKTQGQAKNIGVSNFTIRHLEDLKTYAKIIPAVNQVELHIFLQQPELLDYCRANNIVVEAYSPLAHAKALHEPMLASLAKKYNKSPAQIMLRWCIQQGVVVLPKSVNPERIEQNIKIFDFEIFPSDMEKLKTLNTDFRTCWDPTLVP